MNVALFNAVAAVRAKSSADSISNVPPAPGRDALAILPSGVPALKKTGAAIACVAIIPKRDSEARHARDPNRISLSLFSQSIVCRADAGAICKGSLATS